MNLEKIAEILIIIHAGFGGLALLAGAIALSARKGLTVHKKSGKLFYYSMLLAALVAFVVAALPNHQSPFLFSIGIFSSYFLISGYRSLRFKQKEFDIRTDKLIAYIIILTGITMILYPITLKGTINIILLVFGSVGLVFGLRDLMLLKQPQKLQKDWLKLHLGKMTGGYIASVTAFFVVNEFLPGIYNWFVPGILGSIYITYWMMKLQRTKY